MPSQITISLASPAQRREIYGIRHEVYARELRQHPENSEAMLRDQLDEYNEYLVAREGGCIAGFVAITPPTAGRYSIDKYFSRAATSLSYDDGLFEVRLLTVVNHWRHTTLAPLLMYAALQYVASRGGTAIVAIGRLEVLPLYERAGLKRHGLRTVAGAVTYELMSASVQELRARAAQSDSLIRRMTENVEWCVPGISSRSVQCDHGGAFWEALDDHFEHLDHRDGVINADVLDAWFDPAPQVIERVRALLPFALKTSPPTHCEGLRAVIANARGVPESTVLPGAGSSDLIYAAFARLMRPAARVLVLDPTYGEYGHVLQHIIGARVDRFVLDRTRDYDLDPVSLGRRLAAGVYDWVVLVNPNSPTGRHVDPDALRWACSHAGPSTRFWIDETYLEYVGADRSLESFAANSHHVVVCKSMSKVYALSGIRVAYLVGPSTLIEDLGTVTPPWAVGLPAQIAACAAFDAVDYYRARWNETRLLRHALQVGLESLGWSVTPGCANFVMCHLPEDGPSAADIVKAARDRRLFIRDVGNMGSMLGTHAVRVAVKDQPTNACMIAILADAVAFCSDRLADSATAMVYSPST